MGIIFDFGRLKILVLLPLFLFSAIVSASQHGSDLTYKDKVVHLLAAGLDEERSVIGYHGTNKEAIRSLLRTGFLPAGYKHGISGRIANRGIYIAPVSGVVSHELISSLEPEFMDYTTAQKIAAGYARINGQISCALSLLKIPYNSTLGFEVRDGLDDINMVLAHARMPADIDLQHAYRRWKPKIEEINQRLSATGQNLSKIIAKASSARGYVIGISKDALEKYSLVSVGKDAGVFIELPEDGLDISYITGIEPIGQDEWDFLDQLNQK